ncbi:MAG: phosphodiester glycosidase family protein [Clostridia bacterium]|nr:phosphodiester glycosidase family protein [Clostridia bacterium]
MKVFRWCLAALMLLAMLVLLPRASYADIVEIPLNAKTGVAPQASGYLSATEYEDPSIHVSIGTGRMFDNEYMYARVKIANASQLRTAMSGSFRSSSEAGVTALAKNAKAVVAINGDFFNEGGNKLGYVVRQGEEYRKNLKPYNKTGHYFDVLLIDDQGDFTIIQDCNDEKLKQFTGVVVNSFTFGPALVVDGEMQTEFVDMNNGVYKNGKPVRARRMVIAQTGPLEYLMLTTNGPEDAPDKKGLTIPELAEVIASFEDVQNAYVLDGGTSAQLVFQQTNKKGQLEYVKMNALKNSKVRSVRDILYFSCAYQP